MTQIKILMFLVFLVLLTVASGGAVERNYKNYLYDYGDHKPIDSELKVERGGQAPGFSLPSVRGPQISLEQYRGKKNVVLSFVPAAWTPVCSDQWPGYAITKTFFDEHNAVLLGITVDNIPTLYSWTQQMGTLWFDVLSDFWPHGAVADAYGLLRSDGTAERALVFIDRKGIITNIYVSDINKRPPLEVIFKELEKMGKSE